MTDMIAGPGQGLPLPQALNPRSLWTAPFTPPTNRFELQSGQAILIPAGTWILRGAFINPVSGVQWKDPVTQEWRDLTSLEQTPGMPFGITVRSDGFNYRVINFSGIPFAANVTAGGSGYVASTTTVVASAGGSQWVAVVGGALGAVTIIDGGANYSIPPIVFVPSPPPPGQPAVGHAVLTGGVVTGIVWSDPGAGYTFPPPILLVPDPFDPVILAASTSPTPSAIRDAKASVVLTGAGTVTRVFIVTNGVGGLTTAPTLTISGQGTGATAVVTPLNWIAPANDQLAMQAASGP